MTLSVNVEKFCHLFSKCLLRFTTVFHRVSSDIRKSEWLLVRICLHSAAPPPAPPPTPPRVVRKARTWTLLRSSRFRSARFCILARACSLQRSQHVSLARRWPGPWSCLTPGCARAGPGSRMPAPLCHPASPARPSSWGLISFPSSEFQLSPTLSLAWPLKHYVNDPWMCRFPSWG